MQAKTPPDSYPEFEKISDEALHRRYKESGDLDAYTYLFNKYWHRLVYFVNGRWPDVKEIRLFAEDISDVALFVTLEKPPDNFDKKPFFRVLFRIAVNKAIDRLRALGQPGGDEELDGSEDVIQRQTESKNCISKMGEVHDPWVSIAVEECKSRLAPRSRTVLWMKIAEDRTLKEIGKVLDISHQRVSKIYEKALENLRRCLEGKKIPVQIKEIGHV